MRGGVSRKLRQDPIHHDGVYRRECDVGESHESFQKHPRRLRPGDMPAGALPSPYFSGDQPMKAVSLRAGLIGCLALVFGVRPAAGDEPADRIVPNLAALAGQPMVVLPPPPPWVAGPASQWTIGQIVAEFKKSTDKPPPINYSRQTFVRPDYQWLLAFVKWFRKLGKPLNMHYEDELFDCDKYSRCFVAFADLLARKGGETRGSICVGWATVFNDNSFAGIETGGGHAVVIVGTNRGLFVVEPQNGTIVPLGDYPNRDTLVAVYL
jgi:hypothetical protein